MNVSEPARILILEDDENLRSVLTRVLEDEGYRVTAVGNGEAAVQKASEETFDLMIADIRMDGMDGLEAVEKAQGIQPSIGSLVVSGYASERDTARAERLQVGGYLTKPFKMRELLTYVRDYLKNRGQSQSKAENESFVCQVLDWSLDIAAKTFDEAKSCQGSLVRASRAAESICRHLGFPDSTSIAARWATIILGTSGQSEVALPNFALKPNPHFPDLSSMLVEFSMNRVSEGARLELAAVQLCLEFELETPEDLVERYDSELLEAHKTAIDELIKNNKLVKEKFSARSQRRGNSSLLVLARTFERAGKIVDAKGAFASLWDDSPDSKWRLEGVLGLSRLAAQASEAEACRKACLQALRAAKDLGPSTLASAGLEAALWLESIHAPETEKAFALVSRAIAQVEQAVPLALLRLARERLGGDSPGKDDIRALVAPSAANDLARYIPWLVPHLFARSREQGSTYPDVLIRIVRDFPLEFLRDFAPDECSEECRKAICAVLNQAKFLPDIVLKSMDNDPLAGVKETAIRIRARRSGEAPPELVRVYSFGNLELVGNGGKLEEKAWRTRKVKFLFGLLASDWGKPISSSLLLETFWPKGQARNKKNLYWAASILRRVLRALAPGSDNDPLHREAECSALNTAYPRWHDLEEFEKAAHAIPSFYQNKDYQSALNRGRLVGQLYRGNFLEGCYYDFAVRKRDSLARLAFEAFRRSCESALELNLLEQALELATMGVEVGPHRQEAHALKMRAHIRLNQGERAIKQFQQIEKVLKLEYDLEPTTELLELFHRARLGFTHA